MERKKNAYFEFRKQSIVYYYYFIYYNRERPEGSMLKLDHSRPFSGFPKLLDADVQRFPIGRIECAFRPTFLEYDAILTM